MLPCMDICSRVIHGLQVRRARLRHNHGPDRNPWWTGQCFIRANTVQLPGNSSVLQPSETLMSSNPKFARREFLKASSLAAMAAGFDPATRVLARALASVPAPKPDYTLRIAAGLVELAPRHIVSTV